MNTFCCSALIRSATPGSFLHKMNRNPAQKLVTLFNRNCEVSGLLLQQMAPVHEFECSCRDLEVFERSIDDACGAPSTLGLLLKCPQRQVLRLT